MLRLGIMWCMEHESSDVESDDDDGAVGVGDENVVQSSVDDIDHMQPDWRQFAAAYRGFQLDTTQESLTSNLFTAVKSLKGFVTDCCYSQNAMNMFCSVVFP